MIGMSPFKAATRIELLLPIDITEATFLFPDFSKCLSDANLIANHARQLPIRTPGRQYLENQRMCRQRLKAHLHSIKALKMKYENIMDDYAFTRGELLLVLDKKVERAE
jgi:hypothetical protein